MRTRNINELRAIHAKKMYEKNKDIIQALKLKHGNSKLDHPDVFDEGMTRLGHKNLKENADVIAKYSIDPESKFKIVTPISFSSKNKDGRKEFEDSDGTHIQKYLYKGSGKVVEMSPDKFLNIVAPLNHPDPSSLKDLRKNMGITSGEMPNINVELSDSGEFLRVMGHEGRHRAFVAKEKGIDKIPVMIATRHSDEIMPDNYKDLIKKEMFIRENQGRYR